MGLANVIRQFTVGVSMVLDKAGADKTKKAVMDLGKDLALFGGTVAAAGASLFELANVSGSHSRELENQAAQLGLTTDKLQELGYAAKITANISQDELVGALEGVSKTLYEARNISSDAARTFQKLGVPLELITKEGATSDEVLVALSKTFSKMPDGVYKTALATEAFGSAGAKLIPFLNKGPEGIKALGVEAHKSGLILSKNFLDQGSDYDKKLSKIWFIFKNIAYVIGGSLIKYLTPLVNGFQKFITANQKFISLGIAKTLEGIGKALKIVGFAALDVLQFFVKIIPLFGGMKNAGTVMATLFLTLLAALYPIPVAIAAVVLAIKDLVNYFGGKKSVFGSLVDELKKIWVLKEIGEGIATVFGDVVNVFEKLIDDIKTLFSWTDRFKSLLGPRAKEIGGNFLNFLSNGPSVGGPAVATAGGGGGSPSISMQTQVHVSVPPGMGAATATQVVANGVEQGLNSAALRQVRNQNLGGKKY